MMKKAIGYRPQASGGEFGSARVPASDVARAPFLQPKAYSLKPSPGFTLPELLVALTIFLTVAGGIALLFTGSIRTVRVGHQNITVNEHIRAAMDLLETDLTHAFTSRTYGDYYTFYGTPIGMTFVGLVRPTRNDARPNLSRVTYVLYAASPHGFTSYEDYVPGNTPVTYQLLRYVEPNRDNLESLPISPRIENNQLVSAPWPDPFGAEPIEGGPISNVYWELRNAAEEAMAPTTLDRRQLCEFEDCVAEVLRGKKRELWLRMLAGDNSLPPFWSENYSPPNPDAPSYHDYLLVEDVVLVRNVVDQPLFREHIVTGSPIGQLWPERSATTIADFPFLPFFMYGACCFNNQTQYYPFWNDQRNMIGLGTGIPEGHALFAFGSPMAPRIPVMVDIRMQFLLPSPYAGAPDLFRVFTKLVDVPSGYTRGGMSAG
jgi:prepilin-type N-terminal cleavage/methylation domain-containing protein